MISRFSNYSLKYRDVCVAGEGGTLLNIIPLKVPRGHDWICPQKTLHMVHFRRKEETLGHYMRNVLDESLRKTKKTPVNQCRKILETWKDPVRSPAGSSMQENCTVTRRFRFKFQKYLITLKIGRPKDSILNKEES